MQVILDGEQVADSRRGVFLFETGHPVRHYMPISDTRLDMFAPSRYISRCPYKGISNYHHVTTAPKRHENLVWYYPDPVHEAERIKGLVCFHHELVDTIIVDAAEIPSDATAHRTAISEHIQRGQALPPHQERNDDTPHSR